MPAFSLNDPFGPRLVSIPAAHCTALVTRSASPASSPSSSQSSPSTFTGCSTPSRTKPLVAPLLNLPTIAAVQAHLAAWQAAPTPLISSTALLPSSLLSSLPSLVGHGISAVLVLQDESQDEDGAPSTNPTSPTSPNAANTPSSNLNPDTWSYNPTGTNLESANLHGFPVSLVTDDKAIKGLLSLANDNADKDNASRSSSPRYSAAFDNYMGPPNASSEECLLWLNKEGDREPQCKPLGGQSVWASLPSSLSSPSSSPPLPVTMLASQIDATSLFSTSPSPPSSSPASSILALLLAARSLSSLPPSTRHLMQKDIAVGFFQGDSHGFIGSRSFFTDTSPESPFACRARVPKGPATFDKNSDCCLDPVRVTMDFEDLGKVTTVLAVDQVSLLFWAPLGPCFPLPGVITVITIIVDWGMLLDVAPSPDLFFVSSLLIRFFFQLLLSPVLFSLFPPLSSLLSLFPPLSLPPFSRSA